MTSSSKRKKEKKKDFQKTKLKVGKAKPKPSNYTDTSFQAKAIVLAEQSLRTNAPTTSGQFSHHISLLSSRSDSQRKESLSYLTTAVSSRPVNQPLPQPVGILLPKLLPLVLDSSNGVRTQLLKLLQTLPPDDLEPHSEQLLLYIRAGMTHLAVDIRRSTLDILSWAIETCGPELVECPGGWMKTLGTFLTMLGWSKDESRSSAWSSKSTLSNTDKIPMKALNTLASFLRLGLIEAELEEPREANSARPGFPLDRMHELMIPTKSHAYRHLNLFGASRDEEGDIYGDVEARQRSFKKYQRAFERGLEEAKKAGGETGRAGAAVCKVVVMGMKDTTEDT